MNVVIDGLRYDVKVHGEGFPLVLLHGFTGDSTTWTSFLGSWGKQSTLICPDIVGHGRTDSPDELYRYHIESVARDLDRLLDKVGVNQVDLLGYSMGGRLALTFAQLFPNRVRKLILESASPGLETVKEQEERLMKDAELANFILKQGIVPFVEYWEGIPLFQTMKRLPNIVQEQIRTQRLSNDPKGLANSLRGMGTGSQPSWWSELTQLTCEVLLLTGEEDQKFCRIAEKMSKVLKKVTWITVAKCGHAIHVEEPEKFGTIVSDFILEH